MSAEKLEPGDVVTSKASGNILIICQRVDNNELFGLWLANGNIEKWKFRETSWDMDQIQKNCTYITNISGVAFNEAMINTLQQEGLIKT